jgi:hypothetical protein
MEVGLVTQHYHRPLALRANWKAYLVQTFIYLWTHRSFASETDAYCKQKCTPNTIQGY